MSPQRAMPGSSTLSGNWPAESSRSVAKVGDVEPVLELVADEGSPKQPGPWNKFVRYMSATEDGLSGESRAWRYFRAIRWIAVLVVVVFAALSARQEVCHATTTVRTGLGSFTSLPKAETVNSCGSPGPSELIGYILIIAALLLPDARSLKIGGFEFERLTTEVAKQASGIEQLRQDISTVVSNTNNLSVQVGDVTRLAFADFRAYFRTQRTVLEKIRPLLPGDPQTAAELSKVDEFATRIDADDLNPSELMEVLQSMHFLIAAKLQASGAEGDTVVGAQKASDVLPGLLGGGSSA